MTHVLPRVVIAAPGSGHGKTTIATGLMAALAARGEVVSGHKVGPDYIDPGYHALATGRPGRNLDTFLLGSERIVPLLLHGSRGADLSVIEGVMGLFDGRLATDGEASTAHVARLTASPVILVVDISHASRTWGAVIAGLAAFDRDLRVEGVILNKAGSERHAREVTDATRIPVLGILPRDVRLEVPSRHLGLVPAAERAEAAAGIAQLAALIAEHIDLDAVRKIARSAPELQGAAWDPAQEVHPPSSHRPVVAVAGGTAFTFAYAETTELLTAAGCEVRTFDPVHDRALPEGTAGIYLGGGFPEVHATALAANEPLRRDVARAVAAGVPTVAECAGLLYLCTSLDDLPMVGALSATAAMSPRLTLGYRTARTDTANLLSRPDEVVTGHEFHRTRVEFTKLRDPAWQLDGRPEGIAGPTLHASYLHTHWAGHPALAQRFAEAVHAH